MLFSARPLFQQQLPDCITTTVSSDHMAPTQLTFGGSDDSSSKESNIESPTSMSKLAPEIILQIFKSLDSHHTIIAFNLTSSKFYNVWRLNTASISKKVLSRSIESFDYAQELVRVQEHALGENVLQETEASYQSVLKRNGSFVRNASKVVQAETEMLDSVHADLLFLISEEAFTRVFYRIWTAAIFSRDLETLSDYLEAMPYHELANLYYQSVLMTYFHQQGQRGQQVQIMSLTSRQKIVWEASRVMREKQGKLPGGTA